MKKWNLVIDLAKCMGCHSCAVACHDEYHGNEFPGYAAEMPKHGQRWIDLKQREKGRFPVVEVVNLPVMCYHCDDAPCERAAKDKAVLKREDGIVIIDPVKAKGQRAIVDACPYGAVFWNEEKQLPQAWPFDAHLLDNGWKRTRGSQVCGTGAMRTLQADDEEMRKLAETENLRVLHPEYGTRPRVYYRNLDRWEKEFVAGSLEGAIGGVVECIEGAKVTLSKDGKQLAQTTSDTFGDFRFRGLAPKSGAYRIEISDQRFQPKSLDFELNASEYLGTIPLEARRA